MPALSSETLLEEILSVPGPKRRALVVGDSRFQSLPLAQRLLECTAAAQTECLDDSVFLVEAATSIIELADDDPCEEDAAALSVRAILLCANACRLEGDFPRAERFLSQIAPLIAGSPQASFYLRTLGLLRWEQGHCDEALGFLSRARILFLRQSLAIEEATTSQLLVLLHAELGEDGDSIALFATLNDPRLRPWLSARTAFTGAFCMAPHSPDAARDFLAQGRLLKAIVREQDECLVLDWLEARALARLDAPEAEGLLMDLLRRFRARSSTLHSILLVLDLLAIRVDIGRLVQASDELHPSVIPEIEHSLSSASLTPADCWDKVTAAGVTVRRTLRQAKISLPRLPFAGC
jgi:hypothetical protein